MDLKTLRLTRDGGKVTITLNRPDKLNAINFQMGRELTTLLAELNLDPDVRVLTLTGEGRGFCSGADVSGGDDEQPVDTIELLNSIVRLMKAFRRPVIGAINGAAAGAGFSVAMACDIRIASERARFSAIFVRRALSVDTGLSFYLPRIIGLSKALQMMYTGEILEAAAAERVGLVSEVVKHEELLARADRLASAIADGPPLALSGIRSVTYGALDSSLDAALELEKATNMLLGRTEDFKEGVQAFMEKRQPLFKGR